MKSSGFSDQAEQQQKAGLFELYANSPIPPAEQLTNLGLFMRRQDLSRVLFMNELYQQIVDVHGVAIEFGVRWGQNLALMQSLRGIYEPYNYNRKIIGFDTFTGFPSVDPKDGTSDIAVTGNYAVSDGYEAYLEQVLACHEAFSPIGHIKKFELVKGDATAQFEQFLLDNPETIIAFAYFDFDLYAPTKRCLELLKGHITKGTVLGFDELNMHDFPGETLALKEVLGLDRYRIRRSRYSSVQSYIVID